MRVRVCLESPRRQNTLSTPRRGRRPPRHVSAPALPPGAAPGCRNCTRTARAWTSCGEVLCVRVWFNNPVSTRIAALEHTSRELTGPLFSLLDVAAGVSRAAVTMSRRALGLGIPDPRLHANAHAGTARQLLCMLSFGPSCCNSSKPLGHARGRLFTSSSRPWPPRSRVHLVVRGRGCGSRRFDGSADGRAVEVARDPAAGCQLISRVDVGAHEVAAWR